MRWNKTRTGGACATLCAGLLFCAVTACAQKTGDAVIHCGRLPDDFALTFDRQAWEKYAVAYPAVKGKESIVFGADKWHGMADLSGDFYIGWDSGHLLFLFNVVDDTFHQTRTGRQMWEGDHVELEMLFKDNPNAAEKAEVYQIGLSPGNFGASGDVLLDFPAEVVAWNPPNVSTKGTAVKAQRNKDGYSIAVKMPLALFGFKPGASNAFYLDVNYSDTDSDAPVQEKMSSLSELPWAGTPDAKRLTKVVLENRAQEK